MFCLSISTPTFVVVMKVEMGAMNIGNSAVGGHREGKRLRWIDNIKSVQKSNG